jgi:hypothetical protein
MSNVSAFLSTTSRQNKRSIQGEYFTLTGDWLRDIYDDSHCNIADLPSVNLWQSIDHMIDCGIYIDHYMAFEIDRDIAKVIRFERNDQKRLGDPRVTIHQQDILQVLTDPKRPKTTLTKTGCISFFHFDFCDALTPKYRSFMIVDAVERYMNKKASVIVTFSTRSKGNAERLDLAMSKYIQMLGIKTAHAESRTYYDTCSMRTNLYLLER